MQQCGDCLKVYDESEYPACPYCNGLFRIVRWFSKSRCKHSKNVKMRKH